MYIYRPGIDPYRRSQTAMGVQNGYRSPSRMGNAAPYRSPTRMGLAATIEFEEDFVGNVSALPVCPRTDAGGWCNQGGKAVKMAVNIATAPTTPSGPSWWQTLTAGVTDVLKAKVTPAPSTTTIVSGPPPMSNTVKLALAGGAAVGLYLILKKS